ncbi:hypothetical protein LXL04_015107 [Taraxacum kok-saghyz]
MSDVLPFHIHEEILKMLPIKSLIRFRSVSKTWKSLIDSLEFISAHSHHHNRPQHLLVSYQEPIPRETKYVFFVDDDSFPQQRFVPTFPPSITLPRIVGSSYGLLCLDCSLWELQSYRRTMSVLWNPSIRKSIAIVVPDMPDMSFTGHDTFLGFGVCPVTIDPKIVHITQFRPWIDKKSQTGNFWTVKVYKLSSGKCKSLSRNLPSILIRVRRPQVVINRFIYWCATEYPTLGSTSRSRDLIMSFDLIDENFKVVDLPNSIANPPPTDFSISKLRESLVMIVCNGEKYNKEQVYCTVWLMEDGVERSFTKLYTIKAPGDSIMAMGFRKRGGPIMEVEDYIFDSTKLVVYEPNSQVNSHLLSGSSFKVNSYVETLVLLGRCDCSSY